MFSTELREFVLEYGGHIKDKDLICIIKAKFGLTLTLDAIRKYRQRLGVKKNGFRGGFTL